MITNKLIYLGASIIVVGFFEVAWLVVRNRITTARVAAFGVIVIFAGLAVANIGDVTNIVLSLSGGNSLKIQRVVETKAAEVATDTEQVRQLKGQIQDIGNQITTAQKQIQQACQALIEWSVVLQRESIWVHAMPPPQVAQGDQ